MKMSTISKLACACSLASASAFAAYDGTLSGADSAGAGTLEGSVPIAVVAEGIVVNALQISQFGELSPCVGNRGIDCMPTLSSGEYRAIVNGTLTDPSLISTENGSDLYANALLPAALAGISTGAKSGVFQGLNSTFSAESGNALRQYVGAGEAIDGLSCGVGGALGETLGAGCAGSANSAALLSCIAAGSSFGASAPFFSVFGAVPVTELASVNGDTNIGFIKIDGQAPTLANHMEGDYPIVSNVIGLPTGGMPAPFNMSFGTVGVAVGADVNAHRIGGTPTACAPASLNASAVHGN